MRKQERLKLRFLADLNISPKTVNFLISLGADAKRLDKSESTDYSVIKRAKDENRIVITFDKDFGELYYFLERGKLTIIILSLSDQRFETVNKVLASFLKSVELRNLKNKLIILYHGRYRVVS